MISKDSISSRYGNCTYYLVLSTTKMLDTFPTRIRMKQPLDLEIAGRSQILLRRNKAVGNNTDCKL